MDVRCKEGEVELGNLIIRPMLFVWCLFSSLVIICKIFLLFLPFLSFFTCPRTLCWMLGREIIASLLVEKLNWIPGPILAPSHMHEISSDESPILIRPDWIQLTLEEIKYVVYTSRGMNPLKSSIRSKETGPLKGKLFTLFIWIKSYSMPQLEWYENYPIKHFKHGHIHRKVVGL